MVKKHKKFQYIAAIVFTAAVLLNVYLYMPNLFVMSKENKFDAMAKLYEEDKVQDSGYMLESEAKKFVNAAFSGDAIKIVYMLDDSARYMSNSDGSSIIRHIEKDRYFDGYMATQKTLEYARQKWHISEENGDVVTCIEIKTKEDIQPFQWFIVFNKNRGQWKVIKLENQI